MNDGFWSFPAAPEGSTSSQLINKNEPRSSGLKQLHFVVWRQGRSVHHLPAQERVLKINEAAVKLIDQWTALACPHSDTKLVPNQSADGSSSQSELVSDDYWSSRSSFAHLVVDDLDDERAARTRRHVLAVLQILLHKTTKHTSELWRHKERRGGLTSNQTLFKNV